MEREMASVVVERVLDNRGQVFGGYVRDLLAGEIEKAGDIDVLAPLDCWTEVLAGLLTVGKVEVIPNLTEYYPSGGKKLRVEVGGKLRVDICSVIPPYLDSDVNGMILSREGIVHRDHKRFLTVWNRIMRRQFEVLCALPWRAQKVRNLEERGWVRV